MSKEEIDAESVTKAFSLLTIGSCITKILPLVDPDLPKQPELRWTLSAVKSYYDKYNRAPDFDVLYGLLRSDKKLKPDQKELIEPFIENMQELKPSRKAWDYYADVFEQFMRECYFSNMVKEIAERVNDGDVDTAEEMLADAQPPKRVEVNVSYVPRDIDVVFKQKQEEYSIPTGLEQLDAIMQGGLRPAELGIFLAPTGYGKSMALVHVGAYAWARGMNVVHFSFENSEEETMRRYICNITGHPFDEIQAAGGIRSKFIETLRTQEEAVGSQIAVARLIGSNTDAKTLLANLYNILEYHDFDPNLLIVDYGDLMRPIRRGDNKYEDMQMVFGELRDLAGETGIPIWTATQSNRQGLKAKRVTLDHISESLGKAMVADVVISLSRPDKGNLEEEDEENKEEAILKVVKFRRGEEGHKIYVRTNFAIARFEEVTPLDESDIDERGAAIKARRKKQYDEEEEEED